MPYYDRLVEDPQAALDEAAERRGDSREAMAARLKAIRKAGRGHGHLTLSQAQRFFDENSPPPQDLVTHVEDCDYCTALLNGLEAAAVEEGLTATISRINAARPRSGRETGELVPPIASEAPVVTLAHSTNWRSPLTVSSAIAATAVGAFFIGTLSTGSPGGEPEASADATTDWEDVVNAERYDELIRQYNTLQLELARWQNAVAAGEPIQAARLERLPDDVPVSERQGVSAWVVVDVDSGMVTLQPAASVVDQVDLPDLGDNVVVVNPPTTTEDDTGESAGVRQP